jgi:hypothetical protein
MKETSTSKKNRFNSENTNKFASTDLAKVKTSDDTESGRSRENSSFFLFGFLKPRSTVNQKEWDDTIKDAHKDSDNFDELPKFEYEENNNKKSSFVGEKPEKKKKVERKRSFDPITQNEFKRFGRTVKPADFILGRRMKTLLDFNNKPHRMILTKEYRKYIWMAIRLSSSTLDSS